MWIRVSLILLLVIGSTNGITAQETDDGKFSSIFDGVSTEGWHNPFDWGEVTVVDGEVHLVAQKKFFLMSETQRVTVAAAVSRDNVFKLFYGPVYIVVIKR